MRSRRLSPANRRSSSFRCRSALHSQLCSALSSLLLSFPHCSSTIHSHTSRPKTQSGPSLKQWAVAVQYLSTIFFCRRVAARSWTAASRCTTRRRAPTRRTARCAASRQRPTFSWPTRWCRVRAAASLCLNVQRADCDRNCSCSCSCSYRQ